MQSKTQSEVPVRHPSECIKKASWIYGNRILKEATVKKLRVTTVIKLFIIKLMRLPQGKKCTDDPN